MKTLPHIFENNRKWAETVRNEDPSFFQESGQVQTPRYLWIGCADSRVPASQVCGLGPGEMFVHRNIANLVSSGDLNCLSVIDYAVDFLKVTDIIVCGHYGCGGVEGAIRQMHLGLINHWIKDIAETYDRHYEEIENSCTTHEDKVDRLCELNVERQLVSISSLPAVQKAWVSGQKLNVHGWIYDLSTGLLKDLGQENYRTDQIPESLRLKFKK